MKVYVVSEYEAWEGGSVEAIFDDKEKAFAFLKSKAADKNTLTKWDEYQPESDDRTILLAEITYKDEKYILPHTWKIEEWEITI